MNKYTDTIQQRSRERDFAGESVENAARIPWRSRTKKHETKKTTKSMRVPLLHIEGSI